VQITAATGDKIAAQKGAAKTATRTDSGPSIQASRNIENKTPRKERSQHTKKILSNRGFTTVNSV
jgi:hypothetical protein